MQLIFFAVLEKQNRKDDTVKKEPTKERKRIKK
jgi:hypothetical protein